MNELHSFLDKIKNLIKSKNENGNENGNKNGNINDDKSVINVNNAFATDKINIDILIKKILSLDPEFPNNILFSKDGHKYNELEFFESNLDSSIGLDTKNLSSATPSRNINKAKTFFDNFKKTKTRLGTTLLQDIIINPITKESILVIFN